MTLTKPSGNFRSVFSCVCVLLIADQTDFLNIVLVIVVVAAFSAASYIWTVMLISISQTTTDLFAPAVENVIMSRD